MDNQRLSDNKHSHPHKENIIMLSSEQCFHLWIFVSG